MQGNLREVCGNLDTSGLQEFCSIHSWMFLPREHIAEGCNSSPLNPALPKLERAGRGKLAGDLL